MGRQLAGYTRVSTVEQADLGVSLEAQASMIADYCERRGDTLVGVYVDPGVSGAKALARRPAGARLLDDISRGLVDGIVAVRIDRLFRSVADCANQTNHWREKGVSLHLLDINLDTTTPMGEAFVHLAAVFAQLERRQIQARIKDALARKRARGERLGNVPYGQRVGGDGRTLEIDEEEQGVIDEVIAFRSDGLSLKKIADMLNERRTPSRGTRWHTTTIARIVKRVELVTS